MGGVVSKGALFFIVAQTSPVRNITFCPESMGFSSLSNGTVFMSTYDDPTALAWIWYVRENFKMLRGVCCFAVHHSFVKTLVQTLYHATMIAEHIF